MKPLDTFFCLSAHARWADVGDRERLAIPLKLMAPFLRSLGATNPGTFFYVATCHRVEIYGYGIDPVIVRAAWCDATGAHAESLRIWRESEALEHFARVGAGLESEIIGENQIMGQLRTAMKDNKDAQLLAAPMNHIVQRGLRVARNVRTESRIGEGRENLASLALMSIFDVFESLRDKRILVVGAGNMALLAIEKLRELRAQNITWINRSREKIEAHPYARYCTISEFGELPALASESEVVLLATAAAHPILTRGSKGLIPNRSQLRVILDLGLPRNADSDLADAGFIVRNVDQFKGVLDNKDALQRERIDFAERVLKRDLSAIQSDFDLGQIGPLKSEFLAKWKWLCDEIVLENSREIGYDRERFWAKLGHVLVTKANELGPLEGGQFLRNLVEGLDSVGVNGFDDAVGSDKACKPSSEPRGLESPSGEGPELTTKVLKMSRPEK